jgi:3-oxoacyl-(acyl-carrier-protein) synthase
VDGELWDDFWVHKITNFDINDFNIDKYALRNIETWKQGKKDKDLEYLVAAVKLALDDSQLSFNTDDNTIGLFLTVEHPGFELFCENLITEALLYASNSQENTARLSKRKVFKHLYDKFVQNGYDLQTFMYLFLVAKTFNLHGYSLFTSNACASGVFAMEAAVRQIRYGGSNAAIVAGGDYSCTMFKHLWFHERGLYAQDGKIKPFSKRADGIVLGDGASAIVFEELDHALARNAHIYAEYMGGGFSLEGWKVTVPQIGNDSYHKAIKNALTGSGLRTQDIDFINPHGVGIPVTDGYEAKAIVEIFGGKDEAPLVSAFKPYLGHNLGGSAILETAILLLALENSIIPGTLNLEEIEPKYSIKVVNENTQKLLGTVMKLSCGFAGYNGAVIFRKYA